VQHGIQGALLEMNFSAVAEFAPHLPRGQHEGRAARNGLEFLKPADGCRWQRHSKALSGLTVRVRDKPFGSIEIQMRPFCPRQLADTGAGHQQDFHGQGILLAETRQSRKNRPQFFVG